MTEYEHEKVEKQTTHCTFQRCSHVTDSSDVQKIHISHFCTKKLENFGNLNNKQHEYVRVDDSWVRQSGKYLFLRKALRKVSNANIFDVRHAKLTPS